MRGINCGVYKLPGPVKTFQASHPEKYLIFIYLQQLDGEVWQVSFTVVGLQDPSLYTPVSQHNRNSCFPSLFLSHSPHSCLYQQARAWGLKPKHQRQGNKRGSSSLLILVLWISRWIKITFTVLLSEELVVLIFPSCSFIKNFTTFLFPYFFLPCPFVPPPQGAVHVHYSNIIQG